MIAVGATVGAYRILERIGSGGMGTVYRAEDTRLGRQIALKFVSEEFTSAEHIERFRREARAVSAINHPNICTLHDIGEFEHRPFLVLELLKGHPLTDRILGGPLESAEAVAITKQIVDALDAAHRHGIVHRDVKPANVFVLPGGFVKVLDFGVAKLHTDLTTEKRELATTEFETRVGSIVGTMGYMAPEQTRGQDADHRSDLFSLGVVLYEMLTGVRPFEGPTSDVVLDRIQHHTPPPPSDLNPRVPAPLDAIAARVLEKDQALRYQSAADLRADLDRLTQASGHLHSRRTARARLVLGGVLVVLVTTAISALVWWPHRPAPHRANSPPSPLVRRLTANAWQLAVASASISPDGRFVAYSDAEGVHLITRTSGEIASVANSAGLEIHRWLPDSMHLSVFSAPSNGPFQAWTLAITGDRRPGVDAQNIAPDGLHSLEVRLEPRDPSGLARTDFWVVDQSGKGRRRITSIQGFASEVFWVDPSHVVYATASEGDHTQQALQCLDIRDGSRHELLRSTTALHLLASTLPNGRVLYARSSAYPEAYDELWELTVDHASGELSQPPRQVTRFGEQRIVQLSATSDGATVVLLRRRDQVDVYVGDLAAGNARLTAPSRLTLDDRDEVLEGWMPDSRRIVFTRPSSPSGSRDIYAQALDRPTAAMIIGGAGDQSDPQVTPDKHWMLYLSRDTMGQTRLLRAPLEGGTGDELLVTDKVVHESCGDHGPCILEEWAGEVAPQNRASQEFTRVTVFRLDPILGRRDALFTRGIAWSHYVVSPDGTSLARTVLSSSCRTCSPFQQPVIEVLSLSGTMLRETPLQFTGFGAPSSVAWAPDGHGFFLGSPAGSGLSALYFVDLSGTMHLLWQVSTQGELSAVPSPDGRHLAVRATTTDSNVWSVEAY